MKNGKRRCAAKIQTTGGLLGTTPVDAVNVRIKEEKRVGGDRMKYK